MHVYVRKFYFCKFSNHLFLTNYLILLLYLGPSTVARILAHIHMLLGTKKIYDWFKQQRQSLLGRKRCKQGGNTDDNYIRTAKVYTRWLKRRASSQKTKADRGFIKDSFRLNRKKQTKILRYLYHSSRKHELLHAATLKHNSTSPSNPCYLYLPMVGGCKNFQSCIMHNPRGRHNLIIM